MVMELSRKKIFLLRFTTNRVEIALINPIPPDLAHLPSTPDFTDTFIFTRTPKLEIAKLKSHKSEVSH